MRQIFGFYGKPWILSLFLCSFVTLIEASLCWAQESPQIEPSPQTTEPTTEQQPALPQAEETKETAWPEEIPPLVTKSEDGQHSLRFSTTLQLLILHERKDLATNDHTSELKIRRLRLNLMGNLFGKDLTYRFQFSAAPNQLEVLDYYMEYRSDDQATLKFGNFTIPFSRFRQFSFGNLQSVDWPIITKIFGSERQVGFTVQNGLDKPKPFEYAVGVFDGMNSRKSHGVGMGMLMGETLGNPSSMTDPAPMNDLHPEFVARAAWNVGNPNGKMATDWSRGEFRSSLGMGMAFDPMAERKKEFSLRLVPEWMVQASGFGMILGYYLGFYESENKISQTALAWHGAMGQFSYLFNRWVELAASYAFVANTQKARDEACERADAMIAKAADEEAEGLATQYKSVGKGAADHEATLGVNVYLIGRSLKIQTDAGMAFHQKVGAEMVRDLLLRCQFQLVI